jgi:hypothetical protein
MIVHFPLVFPSAHGIELNGAAESEKKDTEIRLGFT